MNEVFRVLLQYLDSPDSDPTVSLHVCTCSESITLYDTSTVRQSWCPAM